MKAVDAVAQILKKEGVKVVFGYPVNPILEACAKVDIRPVIVRQERTGLHMADAMSRTSSGEQLGVFCSQHGPGTENSFGGVAQAFADNVPMVVLPAGYSRAMNTVRPNFNAYLNYQHITKSIEHVSLGVNAPDALRRAFTQARNGRPGPCMVEIPRDAFMDEVPEPLNYKPSIKVRVAPDPRDVETVARLLVEAEHPVIYAGQGVHYAKAWAQLRALAELLAAPVTTSLQGKSAFPENHPLSLGSGGRAYPRAVHEFLGQADVIFGIGASFTATNYAVPMPKGKGKTFIQSTIDSADLSKDVPVDYAVLGDSGLVLDALLAAVKDRLKNKARDAAPVARRIADMKKEWVAGWMAKLTHGGTPFSPYRVIWDMLHTVDVANTIVTHDAGSPRDQFSPFWECTQPMSYIGWGKTTQLGYGLGLAMGAKLTHPDKTCINIWGDAAIGMTGMDFETAVRERIPIMSMLFNNFSMAIELKVMPVSTEKYRSTDISGNYADMAKAFGGYGERVSKPEDIIPAIKRGVQKTKEGTPVLLEFLTTKETSISEFAPPAG